MTANQLTPDLAAFIEAQTSIFLATASPDSCEGLRFAAATHPIDEFARLLDRQIGWLGALENAIDIERRATVRIAPCPLCAKSGSRRSHSISSSAIDK
jgi:hypothetical protein